ncbi:MAG: class I SAM-dependent methyltransferase [Pseudomonadota bacterium]|nr:class I SAM-dependent methyltransferase [Pseudomonadota bacterium]
MKTILSEQSREQFAASQVQMTQTWFENVRRSGRNVDEFIAKRKAAYLVRWQEAGRYFGAGGRLLDIGGGNSYEELLAYIKSMNWDYWYTDIGESETQHSAQLAKTFGFDPAHFRRGLNHELFYDEASFDAVFSSHCIEHSMDLRLTMVQLNRILKVGGNLVVSIPFGFDAQPNHPYFLMEPDWLTLFEDAGFRIRAYQVGNEYPENGQDLMIAAQKVGPVADRCRLDVGGYVKTNFDFRPFDDPALAYHGARIEKPDHVILEGADWRIDLTLEAGVGEVLPVFISHNWSGVVRVQSGPDAIYGDLFRPQATTQALRLKLSAPSEAGQIVRMSPIGKRDLSLSSQGVFVGVMTR